MKRRHDLSPEAEALIVEAGWEHVELIDGPAAQAMIDGVKAIPSQTYRAAEPEAECEADPDQTSLFDD